MRLTQRRLNRATLARQMLLRRESVDVVDALARIAGLQAQEPASPFIALWTRLADFDADALSAALRDRQLVKTTLHRSTLHIVTADDYRASVEALTSVLRSKWMTQSRGLPVNRDLPTLAGESVAYASEPRTNIEMRDHAETLGEPIPSEDLWRRIRRYGRFIHVPGDEPWSFGRRPVHVAAASWLGGSLLDEEASMEHVVRRHLSAFGPSRLADVSQWSGLAVGRLKVGLDRIEELVVHDDGKGREMYDLPGAALPHEDEPAPPRLLPMWDETLLAYEDRSRTLPDAYRKRVIAKNGDVLPTFTVDGLVAGCWWVDGTGESAHVVLEPFEHVPAQAHRSLEAEGRSLAAFVADREPAVYQRYRRGRPRWRG
jgi:hypothetical protein